jgi:Leucine-rich repeat (LRR) protein
LLTIEWGGIFLIASFYLDLLISIYRVPHHSILISIRKELLVRRNLFIRNGSCVKFKNALIHQIGSDMSNNIEAIYREIKEGLTIEFLKKITIDIIDSYKNRNFLHLKKYISILKLNSETHNAKLFSLLIKKFHPDKHSFIQKLADELYEKNDHDSLIQLHEGYFFDISFARSEPEIDAVFEQEYTYEEDDFGYRETDMSDKDDFGETNLDFGNEEYGFLEALQRTFFGGLDVTIMESDLMNLEGELDLSDYEIYDLNGIEHCLYLNELNLSNNRIEKLGSLSSLLDLNYLFLSNNAIENIEPLENLAHLRELDISFNNISDIRVLEKLKELEYVNLIGNPIRDYSVIDNLIKKGIIVIFEGNILP